MIPATKFNIEQTISHWAIFRVSEIYIGSALPSWESYSCSYSGVHRPDYKELYHPPVSTYAHHHVISHMT